MKRWVGERRAAIDTLATAHAQLGVNGPGRPLEIGRPLAHAYIVRVVAEFQAFTRDLHDLGAAILVAGSMPASGFTALLVGAATEGRQMDRGNADLRTLQNDFRRLGIHDLRAQLAAHNTSWAQPAPKRGDKAYFGDLIRLRNALAHGNQSDLDRLRRDGVLDTVSWARNRLPSLNRMARAFDRTLWQHLRSTFGTDPW